MVFFFYSDYVSEVYGKAAGDYRLAAGDYRFAADDYRFAADGVLTARRNPHSGVDAGPDPDLPLNYLDSLLDFPDSSVYH